MILYFVRHGHPNYKNDCLTDLGKLQAAAAAERLRECGIEKIFASTKGRAWQTAEYTAQMLELPVIPCDFMREISWKPIDGEPPAEKVNAWTIARDRVVKEQPLVDPDWSLQEPYCRNQIVENVKNVSTGLDAWLEDLGFRREGNYYRVAKEPPYENVAMFSHGGSSSAALAHLLNIPFPMVCGSFALDFTSISTLALSNERGALIFPKIRLLNDARHIEGITVENVYDN